MSEHHWATSEQTRLLCALEVWGGGEPQRRVLCVGIRKCRERAKETHALLKPKKDLLLSRSGGYQLLFKTGRRRARLRLPEEMKTLSGEEEKGTS